MSDPIRLHLFDRVDGQDWNDRVTRAYAWAHARALPILDERIAYPPDATEPHPQALRDVMGLCISTQTGLLVWKLTSIGTTDTITWCARQLSPLPIVAAKDNRITRDADDTMTTEPTTWPIIRGAVL